MVCNTRIVMPQRSLPIINRLGLHARAAARFVNLAAEFEADIRVRRDDKDVDGKSILGLLTLAAARGTNIEVHTEGADAQLALDALDGLVSGRFGEDE